MPVKTARTQPSFPRYQPLVLDGSRHIQLPRTRMVLEARNLFGDTPKPRPQFRNY